VDELPVKEKTLVKRTRWFNYFVIELDDLVYIHQRNGKDIWTNLFEFILHESDNSLAGAESLQQQLKDWVGHSGFFIRDISRPYKQQLTHQTIHGQFISVRLAKPPRKPSSCILVSKNLLGKYAFPKMLNAFMNDDQTLS
jgi:A/G-specific adenine glycosylase